MSIIYDLIFGEESKKAIKPDAPKKEYVFEKEVICIHDQKIAEQQLDNSHGVNYDDLENTLNLHHQDDNTVVSE